MCETIFAVVQVYLFTTFRGKYENFYNNKNFVWLIKLLQKILMQTLRRDGTKLNTKLNGQNNMFVFILS